MLGQTRLHWEAFELLTDRKQQIRHHRLVPKTIAPEASLDVIFPAGVPGEGSEHVRSLVGRG